MYGREELEAMTRESHQLEEEHEKLQQRHLKETQASAQREAEVKRRSVPETPEGDTGQHTAGGRGEAQVSPTTDT